MTAFLFTVAFIGLFVTWPLFLIQGWRVMQGWNEVVAPINSMSDAYREKIEWPTLDEADFRNFPFRRGASWRSRRRFWRVLIRGLPPCVPDDRARPALARIRISQLLFCALWITGSILFQVWVPLILLAVWAAFALSLAKPWPTLEELTSSSD